ncbi:hypothetical protein TNCV_96441 [Trichonephila clavipes]|nr:hypothetical protein TNCV_96441 [Trichonephila clavipes]
MPDKYSETFKELGSQSTSKRSTLVTLYFTGNPIRLKMFNSASVTLTELISDTGIASGNFDDMQMAVIRYRFPLDVIGRGPHASIFSLVKTSWITGTNFSGAFFLSLGFPAL